MAKAKAHTLTSIAKVSGISRKTVQEVFSQPGAPERTRPLEELVDYLRKAASGAVTLPPDLAEKMILLKYQSAQERKAYVIEAKEEKRLKNLEKKGLLVERGDVRAQGAAIGVLLSSSLSGMVKDLPSVLSGKSEREIGLILKDKVDALIASIRDGLGKVGKLKAAVSDE